MTKYNLKEMVSDGKRVEFKFYRDGSLWYETENGFLFPVDISDIGTATFNADEKAMLLMRYIRKHIEIVGGGETIYEGHIKSVSHYEIPVSEKEIGRKIPQIAEYFENAK